MQKRVWESRVGYRVGRKKERAPLYIFVPQLQRNGDLEAHKVYGVRDNCSDDEAQRTWESFNFCLYNGWIETWGCKGV